MSAPKIVVYKQIVEGDLRKFTATSNDSPSGGGARDLRFSPASIFLPIFKRMFPNCSGKFSWPNGTTSNVRIGLPTKARPNEVRICSINECFKGDSIPSNARDCILLIVLDEDNKVWPSFTSVSSIKNDGWDPKLKSAILGGLGTPRGSRVTPMGYLDYDNNITYTNGKD